MINYKEYGGLTVPAIRCLFSRAVSGDIVAKEVRNKLIKQGIEYFPDSKTVLRIMTKVNAIDDLVKNYIDKNPNAVILNVGCGFCTRFYRVDNSKITWINIDFKEVGNYWHTVFETTDRHMFLSLDVTKDSLDDIHYDLFLAEGLVYHISKKDAKKIITGHAIFDVLDENRKIPISSVQLWKFKENEWDLKILNKVFVGEANLGYVVLETEDRKKLSEMKLEDYIIAKENFVSDITQLPDVTGVYEYGTTRIPGLSDIDLIISIKDNPKDININKSLETLNLYHKYTEFLKGGTIIIVPHTFLPKLQIIDDFRLKNLYGEEITSLPIDIKNRDILSIMDWLPERVYSIQKIINGDPSERRYSYYGLIRSFLQTINNINKFGVYITGTEELKNHIKEFSYDYKALTMSYLVGIEAIKIWDSYLEDIGEYLLASKLKGYFYINKGPKFAFNTKEDKDYLIIPSKWGSHWYTYSCSNGPISEKIKSSLIIEPFSFIISNNLKDALNSKINLINEMCVFLNKYNFNRGLLRFGWFL